MQGITQISIICCLLLACSNGQDFTGGSSQVQNIDADKRNEDSSNSVNKPTEPNNGDLEKDNEDRNIDEPVQTGGAFLHGGVISSDDEAGTILYGFSIVDRHNKPLEVESDSISVSFEIGLKKEIVSYFPSSDSRYTFEVTLPSENGFIDITFSIFGQERSLKRSVDFVALIEKVEKYEEVREAEVSEASVENRDISDIDLSDIQDSPSEVVTTLDQIKEIGIGNGNLAKAYNTDCSDQQVSTANGLKSSVEKKVDFQVKEDSLLRVSLLNICGVTWENQGGSKIQIRDADGNTIKTVNLVIKQNEEIFTEKVSKGEYSLVITAGGTPYSWDTHDSFYIEELLIESIVVK